MLENEKNWILQNILSNVKDHNSAELLRESLFKIINGFDPIITAAGSGIYPKSITPTSEVPIEIDDKVFLVVEPGTYTNFGNVVLLENHWGFIFKNGSSFTIQSVEMPQYNDTALLDRMTATENKVDNIVTGKIDKNNLVSIQQNDYLITNEGNKSTPLTGAKVSVSELKNIGKYIIGNFKENINYFSNYRLEDALGNKIQGGNLNTLTLNNGYREITTTTENTKLYLNIYHSSSPNYNQNEDIIFVVFNSVPDELINNDKIIYILGGNVRQFIKFNLGNIYKKELQVYYNNSIYEVIKTTTGAQLPTDVTYFKRIVGVDVGVSRTRNLFNKNTDFITTHYVNTSGNLIVNPSTVISKVAVLKLDHDEENSNTKYAINQVTSLGNSYYRVEDLQGALLSYGRVNDLPKSGDGRILTITQDCKFFYNIYFKSGTNTAGEIADINTFQIEKGDVVTSFVPYEVLSSINGLNINQSNGLPNRYFGKNFLTAGDSITQGTEGGYVKYLAEILGTNITNVGSSGSRSGRFVGILTDIKDRSDIDVSTRTAPDYTKFEGGSFMIGTNSDAAIGFGSLADIPTGTVLDFPGNELAYFNSFPNTYYGNVALVIEWIKWKNPKFVINLVSPPFTIASNSNDISNRLKELANYYSVNFIDGTHQSGLALKQRSVYTYDGTHFNTLGNEIWGKFLANKLTA
ncbi:SGNH/GDSL hydrolase family protein [Empedobacter brevis]|uniref:SGNH/GDSL hydrolase family protein n=1 Tax=Empedobacter brevis TaxID=247 RepID=UPI00333F1B6D